MFGVDESRYINHLYRLHDAHAVRHLFGVAGGLDSMVVGEPQILGQVKQAYHEAVGCGAAGPLLSRLFQSALATGKRIRSETTIGRRAVSVPYAAVRLAQTVFPELDGRTAVLLGRGAMSELAARHLRRAGVGRLLAVNRSPERAAEFARRVGAQPQVYAPDLEFLADADILVCCSRSPYPAITAESLAPVMERREGRLLVLVDISVPRAIDPGVSSLENVLLYNIDNLETIVERNRGARSASVTKAEGILAEEAVAFGNWLASRDVAPFIRGFRGHLEDLRAAEVERVFGDGADLTPEQRARIEEFSRALINKIAHNPTRALKANDDPDGTARRIAALTELFGIEIEES
jgi:glutamyl-tRNA reductase